MQMEHSIHGAQLQHAPARLETRCRELSPACSQIDTLLLDVASRLLIHLAAARRWRSWPHPSDATDPLTTMPVGERQRDAQTNPRRADRATRCAPAAGHHYWSERRLRRIRRPRPD